MSVVLVTGCSSGIGRATAQRLAASGDRVFAGVRRPEACAPIDGASLVPLDVRSDESIDTAVGAVLAETGRIDWLVNNAGVVVQWAIEETSDHEAREVFETNFWGPIRLAKAVLPTMRSQGAGRIVNVTSLNGFLPAPFAGFYSASKAALEAASFVLDAETRGLGVAVSIVAPGLFLTKAFANALLPSAQGDPASPYAAKMGRLLAAQPQRLDDAGDPAVVAEAIRRCLESDEPPARVVVGADAEALDEARRAMSDEQLAAALRDAADQL